MTAQEFMEQIGRKAPGPVYFFCPFRSPKARVATFEPVLADRAVTKFTAHYVDPSLRDLAYAAYYADETPAGVVVGEAQTLPFLAERRVILVRNAERYASETAGKALLEYLKSPCDTSVLLFIAKEVDKRTKLYKAIEALGGIVECPELTPREAMAWAKAEITALGKSINEAALQELVGRAGTHLGDLANAVQIVTGFIGGTDRIREQDVIAACSDVAETEVWALTDAIAASDMSAALGSLSRLMGMGKAEDELMGTINWMLNTAYAVASGQAESGAVSPFVAKKMAPLAKKLGVKKLKDAFALCTNTHFQMRNTGANPSLSLELLVIKLAAPRSKPGQPPAA